MSKRQTSKRRVRRRPSDVAIAAALERAKLKRLIHAKREIARLVTELRRVSAHADDALYSFTRETAASLGFELRSRAAGDVLREPAAAAGVSNA